MNPKKELKNVIKPIRMSERLYEDIKQEAIKKNSNFNACALNRLEHYDKAMTPQIMVKIQNFANHACEAVRETSPERANEIQKEASKLWKYLN